MKLFIVTGASGLVGTNLLKSLDKKDDIKIIALVNRTPIHYKSSKIEEIKCNISNKDSLEKVFNKYNYNEKICVHCAGIISIKKKNSNDIYNVNIAGTNNITDLCIKYNYKLIYVSSVDAIEKPPMGKTIAETTTFNPDNLKGAYAKTKAEATSLVLKACSNGSLKASIVFPSAIIGPDDYNKGPFTTLIEMYINNKLPALIKGGYDFVDVRDVVSGIVNISNKNKFGEVYLLTNKYYSVKALIDILSEVTNKKKIKLIIPTWFIKLIAPLIESFSNLRNKKSLFTSYSIFVLHTNSIFSHQKATEELNYNPRDLKITLQDTYKWYLNIKD